MEFVEIIENEEGRRYPGWNVDKGGLYCKRCKEHHEANVVYLYIGVQHSLKVLACKKCSFAFYILRTRRL
jgi:hypothetical protein